MSEVVDLLLRDFLLWLDQDERPYDDVMEAWRTSCPRLPVWEEATARGFVSGRYEQGQGRLLSVSPAGRAHLDANRPGPVRSSG
jgi:D-3-phosphoglycerate dehydrogenase